MGVASVRSLAPGEFFRAARLSEFLAATDGDDRIEVRLDRARSLIALSTQAPAKARAALAELESLNETTGDVAAIVRSLRCRALIPLGEWHLAEPLLAAEAPEGITAIGRAEIALARAMAAMNRGRGGELRAIALQVGAEEADPWYRGVQLFLTACSFGLENEFGAMVQGYRDTVEFMLAAPERTDVTLLARSAHALAGMSQSMFSAERFEFAVSLERLIPWTPDVGIQHFATRRCLAWGHALHGSERTAHRIIIELLDEPAPTPQWRMFIYADHAYLVAATGCDEITDPLVEKATEVALQTDWASMGEERIGLLNLIELVADRNLAAAQAMLEMYERIHVRVATSLSLSHDFRLRAMENHARGAVLAAQGETQAAARTLRDAFDAFSGFGYSWRAAAVSLRLYALTSEPTWLRRAEDAVVEFPNSAIAREIRRRARGSADPRLASLSPAQRRVFDLLCQGKSNKEISSALDISVNTARNHVAAVLACFEAHSRAHLAALARESGLLQ